MTLDDAALAGFSERIAPIAAELGRRFPGERHSRQPIHTFYGGAHLFEAGTVPKLGALALEALDRYAPEPSTLADAIAMPGDAAFHDAVYQRVVEKLEREPVEDFRLDFEDGYGNRPDDEEDGHARSAAAAVADALAAGILPPFAGIRIKPLSGELHRRALRTLDLFVTELTARAGRPPENLVITVPKVQHPEHVAVVANALDAIESGLGLDAGTVGMELMVETTQSIIGPDGAASLLRLVDAGEGRVSAAHFGTYDYTASCQITAAYQAMDHPACDFARSVQQVSLAGTGVWLSDGATNVLPVPVHRGSDLTTAQEDENRRTVHAAWRLHADHVVHSLVHGYYQGWDLHPAQLPTRYSAVYSFFLQSVDAAGVRLRSFVEQAARATLVGDVFDDAATGQALLNFFLRAVNCGAVSEAEAVERTGLTVDELRSRSFTTILARRSVAG